MSYYTKHFYCWVILRGSTNTALPQEKINKIDLTERPHRFCRIHFTGISGYSNLIVFILGYAKNRFKQFIKPVFQWFMQHNVCKWLIFEITKSMHFIILKMLFRSGNHLWILTQSNICLYLKETPKLTGMAPGISKFIPLLNYCISNIC